MLRDTHTHGPHMLARPAKRVRAAAATRACISARVSARRARGGSSSRSKTSKRSCIQQRWMNAERLKVDEKAARRLALRAEAVENAPSELWKKSGHARNARVRRLVENGEPNFDAEEIGLHVCCAGRRVVDELVAENNQLRHEHHVGVRRVALRRELAESQRGALGSALRGGLHIIYMYVPGRL